MSYTFFKKIILACASLGTLAFLGYAVLAGVPQPVQAQTAATTATTDTTTFVGQDILDLVTALNAISIDTSVFSGPLFQHLHDFGTALPAVTPGRYDPFAPLGNDSKTTTSVATTTKTTHPVIKGN